MNTNYSLSVVYLAWLPYGTAYLNNFLESYAHFSSGIKHDLIIAINGEALVKPDIVNEFTTIINNKLTKSVSILHFSSGQDINIYSQIADSSKSEYILFLNSFSVILADNWLKYFADNYTENTGVIGATGSFASYPKMERRKYRLLGNKYKEKYMLIKYLIKLKLFYCKTFPKFPNPHIRTTGFYIKRSLFCTLQYRYPDNKMEAYYFENSRYSMTRQLRQRNLNCYVINKRGEIYDVQNWMNANTFWINNQEDLLISDNQTKKYQAANEELKQHMQIDAWAKKL